jgi:hypothetical protein
MSCPVDTTAVYAMAGYQYDDDTQDAMLTRAENDLGCGLLFDSYNFP